MLLRYALTHEAKLHLAGYQAAQHNALSNEKFIFYVLLFIAGLLTLIVGLLVPDYLLQAFILSQILMWWSAVPLLTRKSYSRLRREARRQSRADPFEYITTRTLELQPGGLSVIAPFGNRYYHNTQLRICDLQNEGYAYIWLLGDELICVPKETVFEGDFDQFTLALQDRIEHRDWVTSFRSMLDQSTFLPNPAEIEPEITFRPFVLVRDLEACLAIYRSNEEHLPQSHLTHCEAFLRSEAWTSYVVMEHRGEMIGCGGLLWQEATDTVQIAYDMIHHDWQRKGLGGLLLMYQLAMLRECTHEQLLGITLETTPLNTGFYLRFGFFVVASQPDRLAADDIVHSLWKYFYPEEILTIYELLKPYQPPTV